MRYRPFVLFIFLYSCSGNPDQQAAAKDRSTTGIPAVDSSIYTGKDSLPQPYSTRSVQHYSKVVGWPAGKTPAAPAGFTVEKFAAGLRNPRNIYVAENGDIFVSEANTTVSGIKKIAAGLSARGRSQNLGESANDVLLFRETAGQGYKKYTYLKGLKQPFGILVLDDHFYVANTDGLMQYDYNPSDTNIHSMGKQILSLPAGGYNNHWTR